MARRLVPLLLAVLALVALWYWNNDIDRFVSAGGGSQSAQPETVREETPPARRSGRADAPSPNLPAATPDPQQEYAERQAFHDRARSFFAEAPALSAEERAARARLLQRDISHYESKGELSAGESFLLHAGIIRETVADEAEQRRQIGALQDRYRIERDQRAAARAARSDPMFDLYKVREQAIVAEVLAMTTIPDGLTRDEYLRRRLQAERESLLGVSTP